MWSSEKVSRVSWAGGRAGAWAQLQQLQVSAVSRTLSFILTILPLLPPRPPLIAQQIVRDSIPGTLVSFELVFIPTPDSRPPTHGLWVARTEVTWDMYDVFAWRLDLPPAERSSAVDAAARPSSPYGAPDYGWGHRGFPAISIAFPAAQAFCAWLSGKTGRRYRLPTEAEWERIGQLAMGNGQWLDSIAWHAGNSAGRSHAVATRRSDALGLFDLFGNAAEWVVAENGEGVIRGGSWRDDAVGPAARAVYSPLWQERDPQFPKSRWWLSDGPFIGFRIIREAS